MEGRIKKDPKNRNLFFYAGEGLVLFVLLLFCLFGRKKEIWTLEGEEAAAGGSWYSQEFSLSPGVYEVEVETAVKEGSQVSLSVESIEETVFRALLQNDISLREGTNRTTFSFFATADMERVHLKAEAAQGEPEFQVLGLRVWKTAKGARCLLFAGICLFALLDSFLLFVKKIREGKITAAGQAVVWILAAAVILATAPYLGDFVSEKETEGFGFFSFWGLPVMTGIQLWMLGRNILVTCLVWFVFWKCFRGKCAALTGTLIYVLSPCRLSLLYEKAGSLPALVLCLLAGFAAAFLLQKAKEKTRKRAALFLGLLILGASVYQLNAMMYEMVPAYLYTVPVVEEIIL